MVPLSVPESRAGLPPASPHGRRVNVRKTVTVLPGGHSVPFFSILLCYKHLLMSYVYVYKPNLLLVTRRWMFIWLQHCL